MIEEQVNMTKDLPFLLEDKVHSCFSRYSLLVTHCVGFADQGVGRLVRESRTLASTCLRHFRLVLFDAALQPFVVVDGNVITGQNPASSEGVGEAIVKALNA